MTGVGSGGEGVRNIIIGVVVVVIVVVVGVG